MQWFVKVNGDRGLLGFRKRYQLLSQLQLSGMIHIARTICKERQGETVHQCRNINPENRTAVRNIEVRPSLGHSSVFTYGLCLCPLHRLKHQRNTSTMRLSCLLPNYQTGAP